MVSPWAQWLGDFFLVIDSPDDDVLFQKEIGAAIFYPITMRR